MLPAPPPISLPSSEHVDVTQTASNPLISLHFTCFFKSPPILHPLKSTAPASLRSILMSHTPDQTSSATRSRPEQLQSYKSLELWRDETPFLPSKGHMVVPETCAIYAKVQLNCFGGSRGPNTLLWCFVVFPLICHTYSIDHCLILPLIFISPVWEDVRPPACLSPVQMRFRALNSLSTDRINTVGAQTNLLCGFPAVEWTKLLQTWGGERLGEILTSLKYFSSKLTE